MYDQHNGYIGIRPVQSEVSLHPSCLSIVLSVLKDVIHRIDPCLEEGDVGIFGFADLANVWFGFSVFALKNCGFSVLGSSTVCGFSRILSLVFGFRQQ